MSPTNVYFKFRSVAPKFFYFGFSKLCMYIKKSIQLLYANGLIQLNEGFPLKKISIFSIIIFFGKLLMLYIGDG